MKDTRSYYKEQSMEMWRKVHTIVDFFNFVRAVQKILNDEESFVSCCLHSSTWSRIATICLNAFFVFHKSQVLMFVFDAMKSLVDYIQVIVVESSATMISSVLLVCFTFITVAKFIVCRHTIHHIHDNNNNCIHYFPPFIF